MLRRNRRAVRVILHLILVPLGYVLAFGLRFDFAIPPAHALALVATLPWLIVSRFATFWLFGVYDGWWRHASLYDLVKLVQAITVGSGAFVVLLFMTQSLSALPRSILLLEWGIAVMVFGGIRFAVRWVREARRRTAPAGRRALVIGAGDTAAGLIRQIREEPGSGIVPVALVDDDPSKRRLRVHGIPVLGTTADLRPLIDRYRIELLIMAIPSATRDLMQRIAERCTGLDVALKVVPSLNELLDGTAHLSQLRTVDVESLLGRNPVSLELSQVESELRGRVVLITGGAGSIGSELARQISRLRPARLIVVEQAESPLYYVHLELIRAHPDLEIVPLVADVANRDRLESIFVAHRPDFVFHAAAYKHVPMMEANVYEAISNNVFGTLNAAECSVRFGAVKFVLISTDKAVYPSSVMGATKRVAERIILGMNGREGVATDFRAVRFGNVLGSEGSVVPLFKRQIAAGGPVTVTDPEVTRFFMTIPEAVQLVLQAATLPETRGRVAMLDMGNPMRIVDLAENLIRLSGLEPYTDIPIVFTGLRPGEKLHEELVSAVEAVIPTSVDKIRIVRTAEERPTELDARLEFLAAALSHGDTDEQLAALCGLVPECMPPLRDRADRAMERLAARALQPR